MNNPEIGLIEKDEATQASPLETWTSPELQNLPVAGTATTFGNVTPDGPTTS